ncbi:MAG: cell division protein FtsZ [Alphaproteobacteria bacterium]|nr:cell division protein FtsZ [Alphaproteobacteria bacterium]
MTDQPNNSGSPTSRVPAPRISVIGVGGAGGNAINNMISADLEGVEFVVANTDAQALDQSLCETQIQLGATLTNGLGAGANPGIGQAAAEEANGAIVSALEGANMVFITAGMGGGTGTGAAPVIAQAARNLGVLSVGVVSKPFDFEGAHRMRQAEAGIAELTKYVDTLIVIPNQNLFRIADEKTTFADAFKLADEVLHSGVRGVTDLMVLPGLVNLDFADVRSIMAGMGKAVMGTGEAEGDDRALQAAQAAISNPLLDDISMKGARSVLINITGGLDLMLMEVDEAANRIREEVDPDANIIFGSAFSDTLDGKIRVSVIATGNEIEKAERLTPRSTGPFVSQQPADPEASNAAEARAATAVAQADTPEEPLTLRLVSTLPASDAEPAPKPDSGVTETAAPSSDPVVIADLDEAQFIWGAEREAEPEEISDNAAEQELAIPPEPEAPPPSQLTSGWNSSRRQKPTFHRPATPVKSESTLEAVENLRANAETTEAKPEVMYYVVWEVDLGARIYKVPEAKLATVRQQPHAQRLKLFDNLQKAKAEANAIFKRVADDRSEKGLPRSILEPTLKDLMRWDEDNVPPYFL